MGMKRNVQERGVSQSIEKMHSSATDLFISLKNGLEDGLSKARKS